MEVDIIRITLDLFNGKNQERGSITSGGTESILLACKAYRDRALALFGTSEPEMIVPVSAHAAFNKAAEYFKIKLIPVDLIDYKTDLKQMQSLITENTILLVGSVPNFPYGIVDNIQEMAKMTNDRIGLHVDCCLGSYIVPFIEDLDPFDFRVEGVTSISCDTHKYGFAPKGTSVLMYRSENYRKYQYFVSSDWVGGIYATTTFSGSRNGAVIAGCFATILYMGKSGYRSASEKIVSTCRYIASEISNHKNIRLIGECNVNVVAFTSDLNLYKVNDHMSKRNFNLNVLSDNCLHIAVTMLTDADLFIKSLYDCLALVMNDQVVEGMAPIYGMSASLEGTGLPEEIAEAYLDILYK